MCWFPCLFMDFVFVNPSASFGYMLCTLFIDIEVNATLERSSLLGKIEPRSVRNLTFNQLVGGSFSLLVTASTLFT